MITIDGSMLECNSVGCGGGSAPFDIQRTENALARVTWTDAMPGPFQLMVTADGTTVVNETLNYVPAGSHETCGKRCYEAGVFVLP